MTLITRRTLLTALAAMGTIAALTACSGATIARTTNESPVTGVSLAEAQAAISAVRAQHGLAPIDPNPLLQRVAQEQVGLMIQSTQIAHTAVRGETFITRLRRQNYLGAAGENLAGGSPTLSATIDGWLNSPPHRRVLLNPDYVQFGIHMARGPSTTFNTYGTYWALIMGIRPPDWAMQA